MRDKVLISHRGASFEIGSGPNIYGIWPVGGDRAHPVAQWPQTPDGWYEAWMRFVTIEAPGSITAVDLRSSTPSVARAGRGDLTLASALLVAGVVLGVIGLFPTYLSGESLAVQPAQLVPHVIYFALWATAAALLVLGGTRARVGALLAAGTTIGTLGFYLGDAGTAISAGSHIMGAGLVLGLVGWGLAAGGTAAAAAHLHSEHVPAGAHPERLRAAVPYVIAAIGTAVTFAPAWDSFTLTSSAGSTSLTAGNAFSNPAPIIAGNVAVMVIIVAVALVAALWRPIVLGAALLAGAVVPMIGQAISAIIQLGESAPSTEFGISASRAASINLHISSGVTGAFYLYCVFVGVLAVLTVGMVVTVRPRRLDEQPAAPVDAPAGAGTATGPSYDWTPERTVE